MKRACNCLRHSEKSYLLSVNIALWFRNLEINKNNNETSKSFSSVDAEKNAENTIWTEHKTSIEVSQLAKVVLEALVINKEKETQIIWGPYRRE